VTLPDAQHHPDFRFSIGAGRVPGGAPMLLVLRGGTLRVFATLVRRIRLRFTPTRVGTTLKFSLFFLDPSRP